MVLLIAPPAGAPYLLLNSSMDVGLLVHTDLAQSPTLGPVPKVARLLPSARSMAFAALQPDDPGRRSETRGPKRSIIAILRRIYSQGTKERASSVSATILASGVRAK